ncbi:MAG: ABC transporter substrate-binding protein [Hyphomicrobiaceae bacterium]
MKRFLLASAALLALPIAAEANCPAITVADMKGVKAGKYPQQYELSEFQKAANCTLSFKGHPDSASHNGKIQGNPSLPALSERIPSEPLVVVPYDSIGKFGGTLDVLSNATEAGTSDFLSVRHVNFVRFSDDLQTIVPNIAKDWKWNDDFTELTFFLRKGHKWSDGQPFTSADVKFWYDDLNFDTNVIKKPKDYLVVGGKRMIVETPDPQTVVFKLPAPKPGLLSHFATHFAQGFQPKHFLGKFHPKHNPDADKEAQKYGFKTGYELINFYHGQSDWTDTPTPMLRDAAKAAKLPYATQPTLESHIYIRDTTEGRHLVANPYFHQVDTQGNQLPYIGEQDELYINENEVRILKLVNAEVDYKSQSLQLPSAPLLLENQEKGNYKVDLRPEITIGVFSFNVTHEDLEKRKVFGDLRFRQAMSIAMNRDELNNTAFFGQGKPQQYVGFSPQPPFVDKKWLTYMTKHDPAKAKSLLDAVGLKDTDNDGFRELPNGAKLVLNLQFATQGIAGQVVEFVCQNWKDVGVNCQVKEVTPDEFRSAQSANKLDVMMWRKSQPIAIILGNNELWVPPFENYFGVRTGMLWAEWVDSKGAKGVEPPDYVKQIAKDIDAFQSSRQGTDEANKLGARMVENMTKNLLFIGTVNAPAPIYHHNKLKNFTNFKTHSYEYYRTYPYRATQWWLDE